ncbi:hypothetical protein AXF42_Ash011130 [Apostasia shenzhenica]|uniref:Uncharacterized protein n=1 Tax=Apostasia shenzhenica TaxID=1088818 RepID=A0A2I0AKX8_9ASPA|nr:hypothetical protein AXF42_Ash011130 [Apostasia shenzhenica]
MPAAATPGSTLTAASPVLTSAKLMPGRRLLRVCPRGVLSVGCIRRGIGIGFARARLAATATFASSPTNRTSFGT